MDGRWGSVKSFDKSDRFKYAILDVVREIHQGIHMGSGDLLSDERLEELSNWLWWRLGGEGWERTTSDRTERFEEAVWSLALVACDEARNEITRRDRVNRKKRDE